MTNIDTELLNLTLDLDQGCISYEDYEIILNRLCEIHGTDYIGNRMVALGLD